MIGMGRGFKLFLWAGLCLELTACGTITPNKIASDEQQRAEQTALQQDMKLLREDMTQVKEKVAELHKMIADRIKAAQPKPAVTAVDIDDDPALGSKDAELAILEFSDYQCPFCATFHNEIFPSLKKEFIDTGKVQFIYRDYAISFHTEAENAAVAANCAGEQHAYFPMQEILFREQEHLGKEAYKKFAEQLKLDVSAFNACMAKEEQRTEVKNDLAYAEELGVQGTPTFYIGRIKDNQVVEVKEIVGAQPQEVFTAAIESFLTTAPAE